MKLRFSRYTHWNIFLMFVAFKKPYHCLIVLCLQDTTELDFNGQQARGLGPLTFEARRGMYVHPTYAVTPQRKPLGIRNGRNSCRVRRWPHKPCAEKQSDSAWN